MDDHIKLSESHLEAIKDVLTFSDVDRYTQVQMLNEIYQLRGALEEVEEMAEHQEYSLPDMCYQILHIARQALEG